MQCQRKPAGDGASSLSAILVDDDYYTYMKSGRKTVDGVTVLDEVHLVPFKAKAFLDLSKRKADGERVDSNDIKKHKKDVFRLVQLFERLENIGSYQPFDQWLYLFEPAENA